MKIRVNSMILILLSLVTALTFFQGPLSAEEPKGVSLKGVYGSFFDVGSAVSPFLLHGENAGHISRHFNSLTAENCMKPAGIWRPDGNFNFQEADKIIHFAKANGMKVRGHTLVWHSQTPNEFFLDAAGKRLTKEALYLRMEDYFQKVMNHFGNDVWCWDVVNEVLADWGDGIYRTKSPWFEICGEDFIARAFKTAHKINPEAKLFLNDYGLINPQKRERAVKLLKKLLAEGVPVHGVGIQAHWNMNTFQAEELQKSIDAFSELGLDVQITELDLSVYPIRRPPMPGESQNSKSSENQKLEYSPEIAEKQAVKYEQIFDILRQNTDKISSVTFWGISDRYSWLNYFPVRGRTDHPLLFDRQLQPKKAFYRVTAPPRYCPPVFSPN